MNKIEWFWYQTSVISEKIFNIAQKYLKNKKLVKTPYTNKHRGCYTSSERIFYRKGGNDMLKAIDVANYMIQQFPDKSITNLKLQKLLYFAQGMYLSRTNEPLFIEDIYAWKYGPVVPEVYKAFSKHVSNIITEPTRNINLEDSITLQEKIIIEQVMSQYGTKDARDLVKITHDQDPWKNVHDEIGLDNVISKGAIRDYFCKH